MRGTTATISAAMCIAILWMTAASGADGEGRGKELFQRRCSGCHAIDQDKEGPRLRGVYGRRSGAVTSFHYSDGLVKAQINWDAAALDKWLADPDKLVPDTDMSFRLEKSDERAEIIAYLKQVSAKR